jgi:hypothetical protein
MYIGAKLKHPPRLCDKKCSFLIFRKKVPGLDDRATKVESTWGCRFLWLAKGRERAYAGLQRIHKKSTSSNHRKGFKSSLTLIKDYTEKKSKAGRQTGAKAGRNRPTVIEIFEGVSNNT